MRYTAEDRTRALEAFQRLKKGDTLYTVLRSVSRSGMSREISLVYFADGYTIHPNWSGAVLTGRSLNRGGTGMPSFPEASATITANNWCRTYRLRCLVKSTHCATNRSNCLSNRLGERNP